MRAVRKMLMQPDPKRKSELLYMCILCVVFGMHMKVLPGGQAIYDQPAYDVALGGVSQQRVYWRRSAWKLKAGDAETRWHHARPSKNLGYYVSCTVNRFVVALRRVVRFPNPCAVCCIWLYIGRRLGLYN